VTTLRSGISYRVDRPGLVSVCLSVTFVRRTQAIEIFGNIARPFVTLVIH